MRVICINSSPSLFNDYQLTEGATYHPFGYLPGIEKGKLLVGLKGVPGWWDYDRFIPYEVDFGLDKQIFEALK